MDCAHCNISQVTLWHPPLKCAHGRQRVGCRALLVRTLQATSSFRCIRRQVTWSLSTSFNFWPNLSEGPPSYANGELLQGGATGCECWSFCRCTFTILVPVSPRKSGGLTPLRRDHFLRNSWPKSSHPGISSVLWNSRVHFWDVEHVPYTDFLGFLGCGFCGVCGAQTWVSSKHQTDIF